MALIEQKLAHPDPASPARRGILGAGAATAALAGLPGQLLAAPQTARPIPPFGARQWLAAPVRVSRDYDVGLDGSGYIAHPYIGVQMGPLASDLLHQVAASYVALRYADYPTALPEEWHGPYWRADGSGWHDVPGGAGFEDGGELRFTPAGDAVGVGITINWRSHVPLPEATAVDLHRQEAAWLTVPGSGGGFEFTRSLLIRRNGEVLLAMATTDPGRAWAISVQRRSATGRVWAAPAVVFSGQPDFVGDLTLLECPSGDLLMFWRSDAGLMVSRQPRGLGAWSTPRISGLVAPTGGTLKALMDPFGNLYVAWLDAFYVSAPKLLLARMCATADRFETPVTLAMRHGATIARFELLADGLPLLAVTEPPLSPSGEQARPPDPIGAPARINLVFAQRNGSFTRAPALTLPVDAGASDVAFDAAGNAIAVWSNDPNQGLTDARYFTQPLTPSHIFASLRPRGGNWTAPRQLDEGGAPARRDQPRITVAPDGVATVLWHRGERVTDARYADPLDRAWIRERVESQRFA